MSSGKPFNEVSPNKCNAGAQPKINMAAKTGNIYISGTMADKIEFLTANLGVFDHSELRKSVFKEFRQ